ncbi:hypothetical protein KBA41_15550, partial [Candidatus Ozemobacteraceae bacterium]|nr:hypothetical protein [Candidatus Ozemobacteraceae bacterium]
MHAYDVSEDGSHRLICQGLSAPVHVDDGELMDVLWQIDMTVASGVPLRRALEIALLHLENGPRKVLVTRLSQYIS